MNTLDSGNANNTDNEKLLYTTQSICAKCIIQHKRNKQFSVSTRVYTLNNNVYMNIECQYHSITSLLCSNMQFYTNMLNNSLYQHNILQQHSNNNNNTIVQSINNSNNNTPLVIEIELYQHNQIQSKHHIEKQIYNILHTYHNQSLIIKLIVGLCDKRQINDINNILQYVYNISKNHNNIVYAIDADYFRLIDLLKHNNSVFIHSNYYPIVSYYLIANEELLFNKQINRLCQLCQEFNNLYLTVYITIQNNELPNFDSVFKTLTQHNNIIRCIVVIYENDVNEIINYVNNSNNQQQIFNHDIYNVLQQLEYDTKYIKTNNYISLQYLNCITQLLHTYIGLPKLAYNNSAFCAYFQLLLPVANNHNSNNNQQFAASLSDLIDIHKLHYNLQPLLLQLHNNNNNNDIQSQTKLLSLYKQIHKTVVNASKQGQSKLVEQLLNNIMYDNSSNVINNTQLLIICNKPNMLCIDELQYKQCHHISHNVNDTDKLLPQLINCI